VKLQLCSNEHHWHRIGSAPEIDISQNFNLPQADLAFCAIATGLTDEAQHLVEKTKYACDYENIAPYHSSL